MPVNQKAVYDCMCMCFHAANKQFLSPCGKKVWEYSVREGNCWQNLLLRRLRDPPRGQQVFCIVSPSFPPSKQGTLSITWLAGDTRDLSFQLTLLFPDRQSQPVFTSCNLTSPKALAVHASWTQIQGNLDNEKGCHRPCIAVLQSWMTR